MFANSIKNIIFDLGGVLINLDFQRSFEALAKLTNKEPNAVIKSLTNDDLFDLHGKGTLSDVEFRDAIRKTLQSPNLNDAEIDEAYNAMLLDIPKERIQLIKKLAGKYRLFILSNTNQIHIDKVNAILFESHGIETLDNLFEKVYYSHLMCMYKPDVEIYQSVLHQHQLKPEETLFIDDNLSNVQGAALTGIQAVHLPIPQLDVIQLFAHEF